MTKTKPAKLDVRRSRKLTSRECCSILGGYVGGMLTSDLIGVENARQGLQLWIEDDAPWAAIRTQAQRDANLTAADIDTAYAESASYQGSGSDPALRMYWRGLGSVISGLRTISSERSVKTAVQWLHETDSFWPTRKEA